MLNATTYRYSLTDKNICNTVCYLDQLKSFIEFPVKLCKVPLTPSLYDALSAVQ